MDKQFLTYSWISIIIIVFYFFWGGGVKKKTVIKSMHIDEYVKKKNDYPCNSKRWFMYFLIITFPFMEKIFRKG